MEKYSISLDRSNVLPVDGTRQKARQSPKSLEFNPIHPNVVETFLLKTKNVLVMARGIVWESLKSLVFILQGP